MKVVITGSSSGIGLAVAKKFLLEGHQVHGIDINCCEIYDKNYVHHLVDVRNTFGLPIIKDVEILINNAGVQNSNDDIGVNLEGLINCTKK